MSAQGGSRGLTDEDITRLRLSADADRNHALVKEFLQKTTAQHRKAIEEHPERTSLTASGVLGVRFLAVGLNQVQMAAVLAVAIDKLARLPEHDDNEGLTLR